MQVECAESFPEPRITCQHRYSRCETLYITGFGQEAALALLDRVRLLDEQAKLTMHRVTAEQEDKAWRWLRKHDERAYSFVDATSFQVMRDRRLREVLAFDQGFAAAGFLELRP